MNLTDYTPESINNFWNFVDIGHIDECWNWNACIRPNGYGRWNAKKSTSGYLNMNASRFALLIKIRHIEDGYYACHTCDNRKCCNPWHLFAGTHQENAEDRDRKGRGAYGERSKMSKLTEIDILSIRNERAAMQTSYPKLADRYKVSRHTIINICSRRTWRHI